MKLIFYLLRLSSQLISLLLGIDFRFLEYSFLLSH